MKKEQTTRELAIEWWRNLGVNKKGVAYVSKLRGEYYPNEFLLSHEQIEHIYLSENPKKKEEIEHYSRLISHAHAMYNTLNYFINNCSTHKTDKVEITREFKNKAKAIINQIDNK